MRNPSVSVILPVRNEKKHIRECLDSILNQDYAKIDEIIISDGLSDDGSREIILEYQIKEQRIKLLSNTKKAQAAALNDCIRSASGEIIVRLDAHAFYPKEYVSLCVRCLLETKAGNVGGSCRIMESDLFIPSIVNLVSGSPFGIGAAKFRQVGYEGFVDSVWPGVFWKNVFDEVGMFREEFVRTEDIEFNQRLREKGYKVYVTPRIKVFYYARDTLRGLFSQNFQNGYGVMQTLVSAMKITAIRHFIPFTFVSSLIILGVLSPFSFLARFMFVLDIFSYLIINFLFSLQISIKKGGKYLFILPIVFTALHFSYGIGSLFGVFRLKRGKW